MTFRNQTYPVIYFLTLETFRGALGFHFNNLPVVAAYSLTGYAWTLGNVQICLAVFPPHACPAIVRARTHGGAGKHSRRRVPFAFRASGFTRRLAPRPGYRAVKSGRGPRSAISGESPRHKTHGTYVCGRVCAWRQMSRLVIFTPAGRAVPVPATSPSTFLSLSPSSVSLPPPCPFYRSRRGLPFAKRHWNRVSCFYSRNNNSEFMRDRSSVPTSVVTPTERTTGRKIVLDPKNARSWSLEKSQRSRHIFYEGEGGRGDSSRNGSALECAISIFKNIRP